MTRRLAADEEPVLAADDYLTHSSLGRVVVDREIAVVEITIQRGPLIQRVRRGFARQTLGKKHFSIEPLLQIIQQRA